MVEFDPKEMVRAQGIGEMTLREAVQKNMAQPPENTARVVWERLSPFADPPFFDASAMAELGALPEFSAQARPAGTDEV
jgi:hypothetical protein